MSETNAKMHHYEFKAEIKQLLNILVHSLYTNREIFLRELISNSSDALDKLRFESNKGTSIADPGLPYEIRLKIDKEAKILRLSDTGIGMTEEDLINNIGTIAKSGSAEFLKQISDEEKNISNIIGKFGVGFYSVFMVADQVVIRTKSFKPEAKAVLWKSDGLGSYDIEEIQENIQRGTSIEIHLKDDCLEFLEEYSIKQIIKKHSNFISFPIFLDDERLNTISALWREPKSAVKQEQYEEFYKYLTFDTDAPQDTIHVSIDAPIQYNALMFIPKKNLDMFGYQKFEYGLDLYVKRVLIQHQNKDLLPEYLSFVKGVVDSEDLPLNISRETLQENAVFNKIASNVTNQILSFLGKMAKDAPEKYQEFWREHGKIFRLGYTDYVNRDKFISLLRFNSSECKEAEELISLDDYIGRLKNDQKEIYYISGSSRKSVEIDPHLDIFKKKGLEVLYLYEPVDDFIMDAIRKYKDYDLKSVEQAELKSLEKFENVNDKAAEAEPMDKDDEKKFNKMLDKIKDILGDRVTQVRVSERLNENPAVLVNPDGGITSQMQKIMQIMNKDASVPKKIFELNKNHKLIRNLLKVFKTNPEDPFISTVVEQLYESSLLLEGYLSDPHAMVNRIKQLLENSSDWYTQLNKE